MSQLQKPFWFRHRFSIRILLSIVAIVALILAAYMTGYHNGILMEHIRFIDGGDQQSAGK
jgi:hypothetical protein